MPTALFTYHNNRPRQILERERATAVPGALCRWISLVEDNMRYAVETTTLSREALLQRYALALYPTRSRITRRRKTSSMVRILYPYRRIAILPLAADEGTSVP